MKKLIPLATLFFIIFVIPSVYAEPSLDVKIIPDPEFNQLWAYETYNINITINEFNISETDYYELSENEYSFGYDTEIDVNRYGKYKYGGRSAGYTIIIPQVDPKVVHIDSKNNSITFNFTIDRDSYEYGLLPFEYLEIIISLKVELNISENNSDIISTKSLKFTLIDETKVEYFEGKYRDMRDEIDTVLQASGLESFNREKYENILNEMNTTLASGNYVEAIEIWEHYNEKDRSDMINGMVTASNTEFEELESLRDLQNHVELLEQDLEILQSEYDQLENTYVALANTYNKVNQELETVKGNLSTAITAVFLTAIVFYFLGRKGARREVEVENA